MELIVDIDSQISSMSFQMTRVFLRVDDPRVPQG